MTTLMVPRLDEQPWPTLGPQVCQFIEEHLVYGPGDLRGEQYRIEPDFRAQLYRMYEVFPRGHRREGKRRFKRVGLSMRKGTAKTEKAALIAACELHPEGPVRCDGFTRSGEPIGRGVRDPYIPLVAYTEEQTEELAFGALYAILSESSIADAFDIGLERILVLDARGRGAGKAVALAGSPNARDGARTTFQHFDETHRFTLESLRRAHQTMLGNVPKRPMADPWSLETTTAYVPGEKSVAEATMDYARQIEAGKVRDPGLFFFHRQAGDGHDLKTTEGVHAAVVEASGPAAGWSDLHTIEAQWDEPGADRAYLERVWLNRPVQSERQAFSAARWAQLADVSAVVADSERVTLGFDGSRFHDATALIGTVVETGFQFTVGIWERDENDPEWEVPRAEVNQAVEETFARLDVVRLYGDPPDWGDEMATWAGKYGNKHRVFEWWTNRLKPMAFALRSYRMAQLVGSLSHDGDPVFARHIANAVRHDLNMWDGDERLWVIRKERGDSPNKIDAAMAACLSWEARLDVMQEPPPPKRTNKAAFF